MSKTDKDYRLSNKSLEDKKGIIKYNVNQGFPTCTHEKIILIGAPATYGCLKCDTTFNLNGRLRFNAFRNRIVVRNKK